MNRRTAAVLGALTVGVLATLATATAHAGPTDEAPPPVPSASASTDGDGAGQGIIGGTPVAEGTYPWMAHLTVATASGPLVCGASLISQDVVITAAHCLDGATGVVVSLGRVAHQDGAKRTVIKHKVGPGPEKGDWAVMRLSSPYQAASYALLPADSSKDQSPHFTVMGWGALKEGGQPVDSLRHVVVPLVPDTKCGPAARVEVCAGDLKKGGKDTCQGDSGGPLAVKSGSRWVLVGVTSWGKGCAKPNEPGHYAQVSALLGPIKAAVAEIGGSAPHSETESE